jgi:hypothetical protein
MARFEPEKAAGVPHCGTTFEAPIGRLVNRKNWLIKDAFLLIKHQS